MKKNKFKILSEKGGLIEKNKEVILIGIFVFVMILGFVLAAAPDWKESAYNQTYYFNEDSIKYYNFSKNLTNPQDIDYYSILDINWENGNIGTDHSSYYWLPWNDTTFSNSSNGVLNVNPALDNETGNFTINVHAQSSEGGASRYFEFIINATNDAPNFILGGIDDVYFLTENQNFLDYLNATDEEEHYPLNFTIDFWNNCTHASWTGRNSGEDCSLTQLGMDFSDINNHDAKMNFTPTSDDVGIYWANISVMDAGALPEYTCPHEYCDSSEYEQNQTSIYSEVISFEILSNLEINASDCNNSVFNESSSGTCQINITSKSSSSSITLSTNASLRNSDPTPYYVNSSWLYSENTTNSDNYVQTFNVNVTPSKTEVGNWTINLTLTDNDYSETVSEIIYIFVNKSDLQEASPALDSIADKNISVDYTEIINITAYDNDFLIPDKNESFGGYNETLIFNLTVLNQSNLSQEISLSNLSLDNIQILEMPILDGNISNANKTTAQLVFSLNTGDIGDYTINLTATDKALNLASILFNLSVFNNSYPSWNDSTENNFSLQEDNNFYWNFSMNVSDPDGTSLVFFYSNDSEFDGFANYFNLTTGVLNFTPTDRDVGFHVVNITASDGYLTDTMQFNFTINNTHDAPIFQSVACNSNASVCSSSQAQINVSEDDFIRISAWINDSDLLIPESQQTDFYSESLSVINTTIINSTGGLVENLFNFSFSSSSPGGLDEIWIYRAEFTPEKEDVGDYNVTFYFNDSSGTIGNWTFNLNITEINHAPILSGSGTNKSTIVNSSFYFDFNATDVEEGNESSGNLTYNLTFLPDGREDFVNSNESIFNTTSGIFNFSFNESHAGAYHINLSVNDSEGLIDSGDFWFFIYDIPLIVFPMENYEFNLTENFTSILNFTANHSVQDNLTFEFYTDFITCSYQNASDCSYSGMVSREKVSGYGNNSSTSWSFMPNFTDETYGNLKNLTLKIYPNNSALTTSQINNISLNRSFKLNISHTNAPVNFSGHISDKGPVAHTSDISVTLGNYFSDADYSDSYYQQSINFSVSSNTSSITGTISNWVLTIAASTATHGSMGVNANDSTLADTSNTFLITFINPTTQTVTTPSGGGGGSRTEVPVTMKLILPDPISTYANDSITIPIKIQNDGEQTFYGINLTGNVFKDSVLRDDFEISFNKSYFVSLLSGATESVLMTVVFDSEEKGRYEININATSQTPDYSDWGKIYLDVRDPLEAEEKVKFASEFIFENPECAELTEIVREAETLIEQGNFALARAKATEAVDACKEIISTTGRFNLDKTLSQPVSQYLFILSVSLVIGGLLYYYYRRLKMKRDYLYMTEGNI
ncbi:hypothetical protein K9L16_00645 [Candidatus Pacearchaeota archaeon]|nr:hypothetical protein [Candidatus Pacearchaeota archaeon]